MVPASRAGSGTRFSSRQSGPARTCRSRHPESKPKSPPPPTGSAAGMSRAPAVMLLSMRSDTASGSEYPVALRDSMRASARGASRSKSAGTAPPMCGGIPRPPVFITQATRGRIAGPGPRCPRAPAMASSVLNLGVCSPFSSRTRVTRPMSAERASASWVSPADSLNPADALPQRPSPLGWLSPHWSAGRIGRSSGGRSPKES